MRNIIFATLLLLVLHSVKAQLPGKFKGQEPIKGVPTEDRPVQKQWKGIFSFPGSDVFFSNNFPGARLNGLSKLNDSIYTVLITSENTPVNSSPWYAFKVWSKTPHDIIIRLTYQQGASHRYRPKLSKDGRDWAFVEGLAAGSKPDSLQSGFEFRLKVDRDTSWIAAQELITSIDIQRWTVQLSKKTSATAVTIGKTHLGKSLSVLKTGNLQSRNRVLIIGRQHPPEVTGQIAEQAFIERVTANDSLARAFRQRFLVYLVPLMNPDGVDEGFWRHNAGGVDLNRDWHAFNQPETKAVRDFLKQELDGTGNKLWFGLDFHSTHDDIFYIVDPRLKGLLPGLVHDWLQVFQQRIPGYEPNIKPLYSEGPTYTSFSYLFQTYGAEALVYEIGDNTSREFIIKKSEVGAEAMMKLLLERVK